MKAPFPMISANKTVDKVTWYRSPIDNRRLRELTRKSDISGLIQSVGHLALITLTGIAAYTFFAREMWIGFAAAIMLHGIIFSFIPGLATHELSHGTVFKTRVLNDFFLRLYCLLGWTNLYHYKASHTYHHQFTLYRDGDGEAVLPGNPSLRILKILGLITFDVQTFAKIFYGTAKLAFTGRFCGVYEPVWSETIFTGINADKKKKAIRWARIVLLFHGTIAALSIVSQMWVLLVLITIGPFLVNIWRYLIGATMHIGLRDNVPDWRKCARTIRLDPFSRFIYWNMNFHIEHHMFAAVPCYRLKSLNRDLADDMPKQRTLIQAWREMRYVYCRQKTEPSYQFDTEIPQRIQK